MLEKEFDQLVLSLEHLLLHDHGLCSYCVIIMGGLNTFCGDVFMIRHLVGKRVLIVPHDSSSAIGLFFEFRLC